MLILVLFYVIRDDVNCRIFLWFLSFCSFCRDGVSCQIFWLSIPLTVVLLYLLLLINAFIHSAVEVCLEARSVPCQNLQRGHRLTAPVRWTTDAVWCLPNALDVQQPQPSLLPRDRTLTVDWSLKPWYTHDSSACCMSDTSKMRTIYSII